MQITRSQRSVQLSVLLATICSVFLLIGGAAEADEVPAPGIEYLVESGDTLWDIASSHVSSEVDVRDFIREIKQSSGITTSDLQPGQLLVIPHP